MDLGFAGKRVLVTGSNKGIGLAVAKAFIAEGARVAIHSSKLERSQKTATELGHDCLPLGADLGSLEEIDAMFDCITEKWGALDILVNNAAVMIRGELATFSMADWDRIHSVNLRGVFYCCQKALPLLRRSAAGCIVNTSSNASNMPVYGAGAYAAAKGGINTLTKALAGEWAPYGIRVNAYLPGFIPTDQNLASRQAAGDESVLTRSISLHRLGKTEEMASVVLFLCSPLASYITGELIVANGGKLAVQNPWKGWGEK